MPTLPTTAFDKTKASFIRKSYIVFTPTGGSPVTLIGKVSEIEGKLTTVELKAPDTQGILRTVRSAATVAEESITITDMEDVDNILSLLGSLTQMVTGTAQAFFIDPSDASGHVRYLTDSFACSVMRDGNLKTGAEFTKNPTLKFVSEKGGPITLTANAAVT